LDFWNYEDGYNGIINYLEGNGKESDLGGFV